MAKSHAQGKSLRAVLRIFSLFGHPVRVVIFQRLARAPMTAGDLAHGLPISRTAVVQHLKLLQAAQLVDVRPDGRARLYVVSPKGLVPLAQWLKKYGRE